MAQRLRSPTALAEDVSLALSTHIKQLTTTYNFSSGDLKPLASMDTCAQVHAHTHSHKHTHTHT